MNPRYRIISVALLVLLVVTLVGLVLTSKPIAPPRRASAYRNNAFYRPLTAAQDHFDTARQLAARAVAPEEQWVAREVLRIADIEVDLAFATALREATEHPAPLSSEAQSISDRLKNAQSQLDGDHAEIERLKKSLAGANESASTRLHQQLDLLQAQADLDQDELDDAHQDLIRAGGDPRGAIERMKQRYEAREQANGGLQNLVPTGAHDSVETTPSRNVVALARAWYSLNGKIEELRRAEQDVRAQVGETTLTHNAMDRQEGEQAAQTGSGTIAPSSDSGAAHITSLKKRSAERKSLVVVDKRIENETELADTYKRWSGVVQERARQCVHRLLYCLLWILIIAMATTATDIWLRRSTLRLTSDRKQANTFHSMASYASRGAGGLLMLLVIFGPPSQFAAVLALAGAGLTVVLKDFVVALIGWFVLMGRNGIRAGDWVEINGVSGEVLEIGPMRTILLETGNWSDAGHPTGRRVAFMNGFAVEGNYFNFSTSGQWMWDEIQFSVPLDSDPFAMAETVKHMVASETRKNAQLAADEWRRVASGAAPEAFRGDPVMSVRPTGSGTNLVVRYVTRANEQHELRSRIYRAMIDLQRGKYVSQPAP